MKTIEFIKEDLKKNLKGSRYEHSLRVADTAKKLAKIYGADEDKAYLAGLIHDSAKYNKNPFELAEEFNFKLSQNLIDSPQLIHCYLAPFKAKRDYQINDEEILEAIKSHTTGKINMSLLDKIIFIADYIEPGRDFDGVCEARRLSEEDLNLACLYKFDSTIKFLIKEKEVIDLETIRARNNLLEKLWLNF